MTVVKASQLSDRRAFLQRAGASALGAAMGVFPGIERVRAAEQKPRVKVAAVLTTFFFRSHAHVLLENFLNPYYFNGYLCPV